MKGTFDINFILSIIRQASIGYLRTNSTQDFMKSYNIQIMRQAVKRAEEETDWEDDIKFLLSNVRARENGLVFFLELFSMASWNRIQVDQYRIYKQQFLDKQRIYTSQIRQLLEKLIGEPLTSSQTRSFWLKLKSILRVSLERARTMGLLNQHLSKKYQEVMALIEIAHEQSAQMKDYLKVEQLLKKRTVEALITTKQILIDTPEAQQQTNKNRSQTFLKLNSKPAESLNLSPNQPKSMHTPLELDAGSMKKLKSMTRVKKRTEKVKRRADNSPCKKSMLAWQKYERAIADVIDCRFECAIDRKKTRAENQDKIYEQLFQRNIACHKLITKFVHNSSKLTAIIQLSKQKIAQKRFNSGIRLQQSTMSGKHQMGNKLASNKLATRPKTSKKSKGNASRLFSGQGQKLTEIRL